MKFTTVVVDGGSGDVDSIMNCWSSDQHYAVVDSSGEVALTSSSSDELKLLDPVVEGKATMDVLDSLLSGTQVGNNNSFAELKPLPPFITSYTGQVRLNDIRLNEFYAPSPQSQQQQQIPSPNSGVVGSSNRLETNNNNSNVNNNNNVYKNCSVSTSGNELYYMTEPVTSTVDGLVTKHDDVILGSIADSEMDDFAAIIGNVMADTTVHNAGLDSVADVINRDAWMDFDLIDTCTAKDADYLHEMANHFVNDCSPSPPSSNPSVVSPPSSSQQQQASSSTLQSLLTQGTPPANYQAINSSNIKREPATYHHMPLLQSRLQNGANGNSMMNNKDPQQQQQQQQQFLPYCNGGAGGGKDMLPHTTLASPPGHVTTSELVNGGPSPPRFNSGAPSRNNNAKFRPANNRGELSSLDGYGGGSMSTPPAKKSKSRSKNKLNAQNSGNSGAAAAGLATYPDGSAKEKPVHHCSICNRGFLNKSNIKVHLRTHTGEKPFRCEVCGKAFRQKAHLIKHQQIHKRVGRD
ncbi:ichor [Neocloeon triangulifer]|uniref:ichor n=1 Tax=Neocloeon triangulifer TaxID=2078957 RepID=UPI00286F9908|nr:ichor [Neocloeon triangulifer]XP_059490526.1 ichor [Neocloeon triangulifer]